MPAIFHVKIEDESFDGAVNHIVEASDDDTVWHCEEAGDNFDGAIFHVKWAEDGHEEPVWRVSGISRGTVTTVGPAVSPLLLPDAIANSLQYVKAYGGTEQNGTPTPDAPVDIVCNNGVLKVRHQSGLPIGYQAYEYITTNGNKWLDTGVKLASTDVVEAEFKNGSATGYGALYGVFAAGDSSAFYANGTYYGYDVANNKVDTGVSVDTAWHTLRQDFGNGIITLDGNDTTYTPFEFENTRDNYLFARFYNNGYGYGFKGSCKRFKVFRNGVLICDLIPVVQLSDDAIGMYDLVQNEFRGNLGSGDFTISNPIDDLEIYADGTVETIVANSKNYLTRDGETTGQIINSDGTVSSNSNYAITAPCQLPAGDYTCTWNTGSGSRPFGIFECDTDGNIIPTESGGQIFYDSVAELGINTGAFTISTPKLVRISFRRNATDLSIRLLLGTATAEMLLKVGDYADVQEILSGNITRNVGIKVLTGEENFETATATNCYSLTNTLGTGNFADRTIVCSHFGSTSTLPGTDDRQGLAFIVNKGTEYTIAFGATTQFSTQSQWKDWLAAQAAAGTPVIIVYPLATATTESVAGQTLQVDEGDNTIEITQASIDGLELEAKYMKGVVASAQEVEPQGLDNNVSVSLS